MADLLQRFAATLTSMSDLALAHPVDQAELLLETATIGARRLDLVYAPFDHVNPNARIAIVGLTPGRRQASDALRACRDALIRGRSLKEASAEAKAFASFSGPMRQNLVAMLDKIGVATLLGLQTCSSLWTQHSGLVHFTSAVRYPLFMDGANWSGTPDLLRTPAIKRWLEAYAPAEFEQLDGAVYIPLGETVERALIHLGEQGVLRREAIITGLPHPSGANAERISCFLGRKAPELASSRTNGRALLAARYNAAAQVAKLIKAWGFASSTLANSAWDEASR